MNWLTILSAILGGWAVLRILGGEMQRQMINLENDVLKAARETNAKATSNP